LDGYKNYHQNTLRSFSENRCLLKVFSLLFLQKAYHIKKDGVSSNGKIGLAVNSKIITASENDRKLALKKKIAPAHKMLTIHNGIDQIEQQVAPIREKQEHPLVVMVARFEVPKRLFTNVSENAICLRTSCIKVR